MKFANTKSTAQTRTYCTVACSALVLALNAGCFFHTGPIQPDVHFQIAAGSATSGTDTLATLSISGRDYRPQAITSSDLRVELSGPSQSSQSQIAVNTVLDDRNQNGLWDADETVAVVEASNIVDTQHAGSELVIRWDTQAWGSRTVAVLFTQPVFTIEDAPDTLSEQRDRLCSITFRGPHAFSPSRVLVMVSGIQSWASASETGNGPVFDAGFDTNGNGLWDAGERLTLSDDLLSSTNLRARDRHAFTVQVSVQISGVAAYSEQLTWTAD